MGCLGTQHPAPEVLFVVFDLPTLLLPTWFIEIPKLTSHARRVFILTLTNTVHFSFPQMKDHGHIKATVLRTAREKQNLHSSDLV